MAKQKAARERLSARGLQGAYRLQLPTTGPRVSPPPKTGAGAARAGGLPGPPGFAALKEDNFQKALRVFFSAGWEVQVKRLPNTDGCM